MARPRCRLSVPVTAVLALAVGSAAHAHIVPSPSFVESGKVATVELAGPNERDWQMTEFAILAPDGIRIVRAEPEGPWQVVESSPSEVSWSGGTLAPDEEIVFRIELEATTPPGPVTLEAEQRYPGGEVVRWDVPLTVLPGAESEEQNLGAALAVGAVGLLVVLAIGAVAWRKRTGDSRRTGDT